MRIVKKPMNMRLSERTRMLMAALAEKHDTTETAIVEMAVRNLAEREAINPSASEKKAEISL